MSHQPSVARLKSSCPRRWGQGSRTPAHGRYRQAKILQPGRAQRDLQKAVVDPSCALWQADRAVQPGQQWEQATLCYCLSHLALSA